MMFTTGGTSPQRVKKIVHLGNTFEYPADSLIGTFLEAGKGWDNHLEQVLRVLLPEDDPVVCEVGSNIGASLMVMLPAKPEATFMAFEPSTHFRRFLERNLRHAGANNVTVWPLLVGEDSRPQTLMVHTSSAAVGRKGYDEHRFVESEYCYATTLDRLFGDERRVDFIKVDTDGFEPQVFRGAGRTLEVWRPVLHFEFTPSVIGDPAGFLGWLGSLGYRRFLCLEPEGEVLGVYGAPEAIQLSQEEYCDLVTAVEHTPRAEALEELARVLSGSGAVPTGETGAVEETEVGAASRPEGASEAPRPVPPGGVSPEEARRRVEEVEHWYHEIEVAPGVVTPGTHRSALALRQMRLPDSMEGMRVLDVGARDGFFSFEAERRGAEVLAIDAVALEHLHGFRVARELLGSSVQIRTANVYNLDPGDVGTFDAIFFLGVLYHLRDPMLALDRLWSVAETGAAIWVESHTIDHGLVLKHGSSDLSDLSEVAPGLVDVPVAQFYPGRALGPNASNWWGPNLAALKAMTREAGFEILRAETFGSRGLVVGRKIEDPETEFNRDFDRGENTSDAGMAWADKEIWSNQRRARPGG